MTSLAEEDAGCAEPRAGIPKRKTKTPAKTAHPMRLFSIVNDLLPGRKAASVRQRARIVHAFVQ
jgi:hypothetical protein